LKKYMLSGCKIITYTHDMEWQRKNEA
jgi:hypothetical protein